MNMVLEDVCETWVEVPRGNKGKKAKPVQRERFFSKLFLRGDSVIFVVRKLNKAL
jgi:small nuclear ribonucleoprotein D2